MSGGRERKRARQCRSLVVVADAGSHRKWSSSTLMVVVNASRRHKNLDLGSPLLKTFEKKIVVRSSVAFWKDSWVGAGVPLKSCFPRLYAKKAYKHVPFKERWMLSDGVWKGNLEWNSNFCNRTLEDLHSLETFLASCRFLSRGKDYWS
ncbi:hypothetical protein OSB04_012818 [Centaurea solstitialis]|uniref:Reverse transcriptase zinc-binding domain-containing protein n=1 Tax=Centaurea solstitialis TaxID=347529 RepID=A0AA38TDT6_9ASTR|nr:hypothetical protein OSB04_012818 [Centaurea solstitialis]